MVVFNWWYRFFHKDQVQSVLISRNCTFVVLFNRFQEVYLCLFFIIWSLHWRFVLYHCCHYFDEIQIPTETNHGSCWTLCLYGRYKILWITGIQAIWQFMDRDVTHKILYGLTHKILYGPKRSWGPHSILWVIDRSINCHLARSAVNYLLLLGLYWPKTKSEVNIILTGPCITYWPRKKSIVDEYYTLRLYFPYLSLLASRSI
jgi:hypothetical protein